MVRRGSGVRPSAPPADDYYAPGFYDEPFYAQIDAPSTSPPPPYPVYPASPPPTVRQCSRRPSEQPLAPLPVVQPYARASSAPIGRRAARFDLKFPGKKDPGRYARRTFNPIVLTRRGCTDVCCCLLFLVFVVGWGFVAVLGESLMGDASKVRDALAFMWGKPERLIHPSDSLGRICGYNRPGAYDLR